MEVTRLQELFDRWLSRAATQAEEQELMEMLADPKFEQERYRLTEASFDSFT